MSAIKINGLSFVYSKRSPFEKVALDNVFLEIPEGEFVCIVGQTGSGKSTLVQHFNGLIKAQSGTIEVLGRNISDKKVLKELRFDVGMVFQYPEYQLFEDTVAKDVAFGPKNMKLSVEEIDRRVRRAMQVVGLNYDAFAERSPFELSGGEKRRAAIAGVIAMEPKILVLDEPFAGLDPIGVQEISELILKLKAEISPTIVLVSHSMNAVAELADRVVVLNDGKIVGNDTPQRVFGDRSLIRDAGLDLPFAAEFCDMLNEKGVDMPLNIVTKKALVAELKKRTTPIKKDEESGSESISETPFGSEEYDV